MRSNLSFGSCHTGDFCLRGRRRGRAGGRTASLDALPLLRQSCRTVQRTHASNELSKATSEKVARACLSVLLESAILHPVPLAAFASAPAMWRSPVLLSRSKWKGVHERPTDAASRPALLTRLPHQCRTLSPSPASPKPSRPTRRSVQLLATAPSCRSTSGAPVSSAFAQDCAHELPSNRATFLVHNGKDYIPLHVTPAHVGHKLGEFAHSKKPARHTYVPPSAPEGSEERNC